MVARVIRLLGVLLLGLASCRSEAYHSLPGDWDILPSRFRGGDESDAMSGSVLLVADNQLHNVYSEPVALLRTGLADRFVGSAIRPPQLDLFGQDLLRLIVESHADSETPVLHLGDAADLSCKEEFLDFCDLMSPAEGGWFLAPGNHDGIYFGNEYPDPSGSRWRAACSGAQGPLTKSDVVRLYLAALLYRDEGYAREIRRLAGVEPPREGEGQRDYQERVAPEIVASGHWMAEGGARSTLRGIAWDIREPERGYESYVVQWIDLTVRPSFPVGAILLDTASYGFRPALLPPHRNAGLTGDITPEQVSQVECWLAGADPSTTWALMGHHPFDALTRSGRTLLDELRTLIGCRLYVSAHTHSGRYIVHGKPDDDRAPDLEDPDAWIELNVGSILDWPQEYRRLSFFRYADFEREGDPVRVGFRSERSTLREELEIELGNPSWQEWLPAPDEPDYSLRYARLDSLGAGDAEIVLKDGLLGLHRRLLRLFATDTASPVPWPQGLEGDEEVIDEITRLLRSSSLQEKTSFLLELRKFEQERPLSRKNMGRRQRFRWGLATAASRYEFRRARHPIEDDWYIVFPADGE